MSYAFTSRFIAMHDFKFINKLFDISKYLKDCGKLILLNCDSSKYISTTNI